MEVKLKDNQARLHDLLNLSFKINRNKVAIHDANETITYSSLEEAIQQCAHEIKRALQLHLLEQPPHFIGLLFSSPLKLLTTILTCIAKGIPYLVLDKTTPLERFRFLLRNSEISICLTDQANHVDIEGTKFIYSPVVFPEIFEKVERNDLFEEITKDDWIYSVYTSGMLYASIQFALPFIFKL